MSDLATLEQLMATRRSVRKFTAELPSEAVLRRLVAAASAAPSASNKQPWRFFVVQQRACIDAMAQAVREAVDEVAAHVLPESEAAFRAYGDYFTRFVEAPVVIVPICRGHTVLSQLCDRGLAADTRERIAAMERDSALVSTALAAQNLLLTAHAMGLGASVMTGPLLASHRLRDILTVPSSWAIVALIPVGFAAEAPPPTERKSVDTIVRWIR
jgi:nitroreductase